MRVIWRRVATKEHKKQAKGLIERLESRVHVGPPIHAAEISTIREFLRESEFSPSSDYFLRLTQIQSRLEKRIEPKAFPTGKHNYGGEAAGYWMQVQSAYDHVILSLCYEGEFNRVPGRIKMSHRFNRAGRIDFVELKFLRSLNPALNGAFRKLIMVKDYASVRKDWREAEAYVLEVLPRELIFLYPDIFKCDRSQLIAWLINIGHGLVQDLVHQLQSGAVDRQPAREEKSQLCLAAVRSDEVAMPILQSASSLVSIVEISDAKTVVVRYNGA